MYEYKYIHKEEEVREAGEEWAFLRICFNFSRCHKLYGYVR